MYKNVDTNLIRQAESRARADGLAITEAVNRYANSIGGLVSAGGGADSPAGYALLESVNFWRAKVKPLEEEQRLTNDKMARFATEEEAANNASMAAFRTT